MKHFFLTILIALSGITISSAQAGNATAGNTNNSPAGNTSAGTSQTQVENPPSNKPNPTAPDQATTNPPNKTVQDIITFLPVSFFLFLILTIFIKLRKDGVKLSDILIDKETAQERIKSNTAVAVAAVNAGQPAPAPLTASQATGSQTPDAPEQSTSRLIAFICGITSIALACCITSYYFYKSFTGTGDVSISNLSNVLYGLGLGVIPYGFNKIAAALK